MKENKNQTIEGNNNEQSINKTENTNITVIDNSVHNHNDISIQVAVNYFQRFFTENAPTLIESATKKANERTELLLQELRRIIEEQQIQINQINTLLEEPNFSFFMIDAQNATVRTEEDAIKSVAQLIIKRMITTEQNSILTLTLNEAINVIPKLLPIHIKMLALNYSFKKVHFNLSSLDDVLNKYERYINIFSEVVAKYKSSIYEHLISCNCATNPALKTTPNLIDFIYNEYLEYTLIGEDLSNIPEDLQTVATKYGLRFEYKRDLSNKVILNRNIVNELLLQMTNEEKEIIDKHFNSKIDKKDFIDYVETHHPDFSKFAKWWDNNVLSNITLNNVGTIIAISYLNAISPKQDQLEYSIWI